MASMKQIKTVNDVPREELVTGGTFACAGCNAILGKKLAIKALGKNTVIVNSTGCMTLTASNKFTPYKVPWVFNAIENAASTASGVLMGLKALKKEKGINILCYCGDGSTYEIGVQSLSGIVQRKENIIYVCYNNSSFANTGFQYSSATPYGARTTTTPVGKKNLIGNLLPRKHMAKVIAAHGAAYVATASTSYPFDYMMKLQKAAKMEGTKFIDLLTPCMPGWLIDDDKGIEVGKLMVESGIWPLYEIEKGQFKLSKEPGMIPVEKALMMQGRFKHLKKADINRIQKIVNDEWKLIKSGRYWEAAEY